jgi:hypothetical protein
MTVKPIELTAHEFRKRLAAGTYQAVTEATVYLSYGTGDSRRDLAYSTYKPGDEIEIPHTTPGHWYGLEPNPGEDFGEHTPATVALL